MNADVQVLIQSYSSFQFINKVIDFWSKTGLKVSIFHEPNEPIHGQYNFSKENLDYFVCGLDYFDRLSFALNHLKSKYVVMIPDDEVMLTSSLIKACKLLDDDPEIGSIGGQTVAIYRYGYCTPLTPAYQSYKEYENLSNDTLKRVYYHFGKDSPIVRTAACYRVMRTEIFEEIISATLRFGRQNIYILEVIADLVLTLRAKSMYMKELVWIRNWIRNSVSLSLGKRSVPFYIWYENNQKTRGIFKEVFYTKYESENKHTVDLAMNYAYRNFKIAETRQTLMHKRYSLNLLRGIYRRFRSIYIIFKNRSKLVVHDEIEPNHKIQMTSEEFTVAISHILSLPN